MILSLIFILLVSFGIGLPLVLLMVPKHNLWGKLGLSYLLGTGLFTVLIYASNLLGLKITLTNTILLFLVFSVPLLIFQSENVRDFNKEIIKSLKVDKLELVDKFLLGGIAFFVISSFISTSYWPVYKWDSLTLYDFRAHVFVETGFVKEALVSLGNKLYFAYPLLTSLLHTIVYLLGGGNPKFVYSLFYLSLGLVFYGQIRELVARKLSLLFTFMLLSVPQVFDQSLISYTNLVYLTYFSLGAIYCFLWDKKRQIGFLMLAATLVGLSTWTRSAEPFWIAILGIAILVSIYRKRFFDILVYILIFFPIQQAWKYFAQIYSLRKSTADEIVIYTSYIPQILNLQRWSEVIVYLHKNIILAWGSVLLLFLATFVYITGKKDLKKNFLVFLLPLSFLVIFILGTYIFSLSYPTWSAIPDSASRVAMIAYPLFIYSSAIVISRINNNS